MGTQTQSQMEMQGDGNSSGNVLNGYVDWRNRPAYKGRHGGLRAAVFVLVAEVFENLAFIANASNLVTYLVGYMHFPVAKASNTVTNFMGTCFLLALLGGFICDAFAVPLRAVIAFTLVELAGMVTLTVQAHARAGAQAQAGGKRATTTTRGQQALLYTGLYVVALGVGGLKGSLPVHGAQQLDHDTDPQERRLRSSFFNWFTFCLCAGSLLAVTFVVWVQDNKGWQWGFTMSTLSLALLLLVFASAMALYRNRIPRGSPLTRLAQVVVAAVVKHRMLRQGQGQGQGRVVNVNVSVNLNTAVHEATTADHKEEDKVNKQKQKPLSTPTSIISTPSDDYLSRTPQFRFLDKAAIRDPRREEEGCGGESEWRLCTQTQVEELKIMLRMLPIFGSTIVMNCCLAQLQTFSVKQALTMERRIGSFTVPAASLTAIPVSIIMLLTPLYDQLLVPLARRVARRETGITHLQRVGAGLALSVAAMGAAASVETRRKRVLLQLDPTTSSSSSRMSFLWLGFQYGILGVADMLVLAGLMELFYTEAPGRMRSMATALCWASTSMGYFLSSVLVDLVNAASSGWLSHSDDLNRCHLERFYWLLCVLGALNLVHFLLWSFWFRYTYKIQPPQHMEM